MVETVSTKVSGRREQSSKDKLKKARVSYLVRDWQTTDDTNSAVGGGKPGAYLRLGGYGDIEEDTDKPEDFYPRKHIEDAGQNNHATQSVGKDEHKRGIALACSGRMLVYAHEKIYINSGDTMDIDSVGDLRINSDSNIQILAGNKKSITVTVGADPNDNGNLGDYTVNCHKDTKNVAGSSYEKVTEDSYKYTQADTYGITMGRDTKVTLGARMWMFIGGAMCINASSTLTINITLDVTLSLGLGISITRRSLSLTGATTSITGSSASITGFSRSITGVGFSKTLVDLATPATNSEVVQLQCQVAQLRASQKSLDSQIAGIKNTIATSNNL